MHASIWVITYFTNIFVTLYLNIITKNNNSLYILNIGQLHRTVPLYCLFFRKMCGCAPHSPTHPRSVILNVGTALGRSMEDVGHRKRLCWTLGDQGTVSLRQRAHKNVRETVPRYNKNERTILLGPTMVSQVFSVRRSHPDTRGATWRMLATQ